MASYVFFPTADKAQDDIWNYTLNEWGQEQAEKYITGLHKHLRELAEQKKFCWPLPNASIVPQDLDLEAYFSQYEHHYIFFKILSKNKIGIMSILHEKANIPIRLIEDLKEIVNSNSI